MLSRLVIIFLPRSKHLLISWLQSPSAVILEPPKINSDPTVAIGIYLRVLYALQLDDDILSLAKDDELGRALQDMNLPQRKRASKK